MTDQELLQQSKDQVAKKYGYKVGDGKDWYRCTFSVSSDLLKEYQDEAALLAIQSAREESDKQKLDAVKWMVSELDRLNDISGQDERIEQQLEVVKELFKLTAQGH